MNIFSVTDNFKIWFMSWSCIQQLFTKPVVGCQMSRPSAFCSGRLGNLKIAGLNPDLVVLSPGQVKPITLKFILVTPKPGVQHYQDRERTAWFSLRIIQLGWIGGHDAIMLVFQWGSTIESPGVHTFTSRCPSPNWACPATVKHSFIPHRTRLVSHSGAIIVTVLRPVPFLKGPSSNYKATQTLHT